ncbi:MAG: polysaccharide deacetylase family protein [Bacteroidetes bacterium]|nr:polysaccharide deacetylase family protein [Bacteroidota bacterium]
MQQNKKICLTFDLEEFDLPNEFGNNLDFEKQLSISTNGVLKVLNILDKHNVECTFFCTANYAKHNVELIKKIAVTHEIASHSYFHSSFSESDYALSKKELEDIIKKPVYGFRMPRMNNVSVKYLHAAGYLYDSSINPTYLPGKYNHFNSKRHIFLKGQITEIPASVSTFLRIPLFWLSFKNLPFKLYLFLCKIELKKRNFLNIYLHPWEFTPWEHANIPFYVKKNNGSNLCNRLENFILAFKSEAQFCPLSFLLNS